MVVKLRLIIFLYLALWLFINIFWILSHNAPPSWDEANYLEASEILHKSIIQGDLFNIYDTSTRLLARRAPLISEIVIPLFLIFGSSYKVALFMNLFLAVIFLIIYYLYIKKTINQKTALLALIFMTANPLFNGLIRNFFVELLLLLVTTLYIYSLTFITSKRKMANMIYIGTTIGIGLMTKITFPLFVVAPSLITLKDIINKDGIKKVLFYLIIVGLISSVIIYPWYSKNLLTSLWHAKRATSGELLGNYYYGPAFYPSSIIKTFQDLANYVISYTHLIVIILAIYLVAKNKKTIDYNLKIILWFLIPFLVLFFGPNKDYRLMLPILAPFYILVAQILLKLGKYYLCTFILIIVTCSLINISHIYPYEAFKPFGMTILAQENGKYLYPPDTRNWDLSTFIKKLSNQVQQNRVDIAIANEQKELNVNNLRYYAIKDGYTNLNIKTLAYFSKNISIDDLEKEMSKYKIVIFKEGGKSNPDNLDQNNLKIKSILSNWNKGEFKYYFPDSGYAEIYLNPHLPINAI